MAISPLDNRFGRLKVLVVDDDQPFCQMMEALLGVKYQVSEVRSATSASDAIAVFDDFDPDVVFVDHRMPSVSGDHLGNLLRKLHPEVLLVSISGLEGKARPAWADEHIMKSGDLFAHLERTLGGNVPRA